MYVNNRLFMKFSLIIFFVVAFTGCSSTHSTYTPELEISRPPKIDSQVEYLLKQPQRSAFRVGMISVGGNGFTKWNDMLNEAKKKAATVGADFILIEKSGVQSQTVYIPGYSSFHSSGTSSLHGSGNINSFNLNGYGNYQASGYSQGPTISTINKPWGIFSAWIYAPSHLGINLENLTVTGFRFYGNAERSGIKIGDKLIGVNTFDIQDPLFLHHIMTINPGDDVELTFIRDNRRISFIVTAIEN